MRLISLKVITTTFDRAIVGFYVRLEGFVPVNVYAFLSGTEMKGGSVLLALFSKEKVSVLLALFSKGIGRVLFALFPQNWTCWLYYMRNRTLALSFVRYFLLEK